MPYSQLDDGDNGDNKPRLLPGKMNSIARYPQEAD
jgi:hypothetical protein